MSYNEAVATLQSALKFGIDPSLEPIKALCTQLGDPQHSYRCIQVAGTNGKSSTTRMIAALLHEQGYAVGLYTSPDLTRYPERMELDGTVVDDARFAAAIEAACTAADACGVEATEFELLTAAALELFARANVDWAVLECGLGGRWDATSVVHPEVAVITGIGLDHTAILGDTVEKIAAEKAAIIKPDCRATVLAANLVAEDVFVEKAAHEDVSLVHADAHRADRVADALAHLPRYQLANAATALTATECALGRSLDDEQARAALLPLQVPGRFEVLRREPLLLIDAAHNPQSARVLADELRRRFDVDGSHELPPLPTLLLGVLADKDVRGVVEALAPLFASIAVTASASPRALPATDLAVIVEDVTGHAPQVQPAIAGALRALAGKDVLATGSITVAGEVKRVWC